MPPQIPGLLELERPFPFLRLPPELRNIVYRYAILPPGCTLAPSPLKQYRILCPNLGILRSCRQLHYEASALLHREAYLCGDLYEYMPYQSDGSLGILGSSINRHMALSPKEFMDKGYCLSRVPAEVLARFWSIKLKIHLGEWTLPDNAAEFQPLLSFLKDLGNLITSDGASRPFSFLFSFALKFELSYSAELHDHLSELDCSRIYSKLQPTMMAISLEAGDPFKDCSSCPGLDPGLEIGLYYFRDSPDGIVRFGDWMREDDGCLVEEDWEEHGFVEGDTVVYVEFNGDEDGDENEDEGSHEGAGENGQENLQDLEDDIDDLEVFYD